MLLQHLVILIIKKIFIINIKKEIVNYFFNKINFKILAFRYFVCADVAVPENAYECGMRPNVLIHVVIMLDL